MGKLHEVLAVEGARRGAFEKVLKETVHVFKDRADLFQAFVRRYEPFSSEDSHEAGVVETQAMTTTVDQRLHYLGDYLREYVDTVWQKEKTNTQALARLDLGDSAIEDVPVAFLLNLENQLAKVRDAFNSIPTHQSGIKWVEDPDHELQPHVVKAESPEMVFRTKNVIKPFELSPATKEHKAQVEKLTEQVPVGKLFKDIWSGMLSPADKSEVLGRLDKLIEAVRVARMRANDTEVVTSKVGDQLIAYLLG